MRPGKEYKKGLCYSVMKKTITLLLCLLLTLSLAACTPSASQEAQATAVPTEVPATAPAEEPAETPAPESKTTVRLGGLTGPTTMGMVKLLEDNEAGETKNGYAFTLAGSADELTPLFVKGELDILSVPVNLGSVLYSKMEGDVEMLCVNTLGVLYILEKGGETVTDMASLRGKTIYATGKGSTPEYVLSYLLAENGLNMEQDVQVEWKSEPAEIVAQLASMENAMCMLPQPYVTVAMSKIEDLHIALDLTEQWDKLGKGTRLITSGVFVRKAFAQAHPEAVVTFLRELAASVEYVNTNVEEAAVLVEKYINVKAPVAQKALPYCHVVCITGEEMRQTAEAYLSILLAQKPQAVGGVLPGDDFYYAP